MNYVETSVARYVSGLIDTSNRWKTAGELDVIQENEIYTAGGLKETKRR